MINFKKLLSYVVFTGLVTATIPAQAELSRNASIFLGVATTAIVGLPLIIISMDKGRESSRPGPLQDANITRSTALKQLIFNIFLGLPFLFSQNPVTLGLKTASITANLALGMEDGENKYAYGAAAGNFLAMIAMAYMKAR